MKNLIKKIGEKLTGCAMKAREAVICRKGEFYVDKTVSIVICVVIGSLLLAIAYQFIKGNISSELDADISAMWSHFVSGTDIPA